MPITKTIGAINVDITARTQKFNKAVNQARGQLFGFANAVKGTVGALSALFLGRELISGVRRFNAELANLAKTADKLSISLENLQKLRFAGGRAGLEQSTVFLGVQRMTRRIQEAAQGTGEAIKALEILGLDPTKLAALDPAEQLMRVADAFAQLEDRSQDLMLAMKLFDTEGVGFINLIRGGRGPMMEAFARLEGLGGVIDESVVRPAERARDAWGDMWAMIKGGAAGTVGAIGDVTAFIPQAAIGVARGREPIRRQMRAAQQAELNKDIMRRRREMERSLKREQELERQRRIGAAVPPVATPMAGDSAAIQRQIASFSGPASLERWRMMIANRIRAFQQARRGRRLGERLLDIQQRPREMARGFTLERAGTAGAYQQQAQIRRNREQIELDRQRNNFLEELVEAVRNSMEFLPLGLGA